MVSNQNRDGGWSCMRGSSRTEFAMYAIPVLLAARELEPAQRGMDRPRSAQRPAEVHHVEVHRSRPRRVSSLGMESFAGFRLALA